MNTNDNRISLADWIANIRESLEEGVRRRKELEAKNGGALATHLAVDEITLEASIETERGDGLTPKITCWVAEISGEKKSQRTATQKVTIKLKPSSAIHLGNSPDAERLTFLPKH